MSGDPLGIPSGATISSSKGVSAKEASLGSDAWARVLP